MYLDSTSLVIKFKLYVKMVCICDLHWSFLCLGNA